MQNIDHRHATSLITWYENHKRSLPWRDTGDPYHVWISEIMLQQTRIEAVIPKYLRFIEALPDIRSLAACDDDRLMFLWEGLGYYSRARNLKKCAKILVEEYDAQLPKDHAKLLKLPGIGPYTAAAIASISYDLPYPSLDGNIYRILARINAYDKDLREDKHKKELAESLKNIYRDDSSLSFSSLNQGFMELGQTICVPNGTPQCEQCCFSDICSAHRNKQWDRYPYLSKLKKRKIIRRTIIVIRNGTSFIIHKRPSTGLLAGLYEFIGVDEPLTQKEVIRYVEDMGMHPIRIHPLPEAVHIFTHLEWHMTAYEVSVEEIMDLKDLSFILKDKKELSSLAIPSAFRVYTDYYALRD